MFRLGSHQNLADYHVPSPDPLLHHAILGLIVTPCFPCVSHVLFWWGDCFSPVRHFSANNFMTSFPHGKTKGWTKVVFEPAHHYLTSVKWHGAWLQRKSFNGQGVKQTQGNKYGYFGRDFGQIAVVIESTPFWGLLFSFITVSKTNWVLAHKFFFFFLPLPYPRNHFNWLIIGNF